MTSSNDESGPLTGVVELVLDDRELLLAVGDDSTEVELGMRFVVLGHANVQTASGRNVKIEFPKVIVKIVRFETDGLVVGRTFRTIKGRPAQNFRSLTDIAMGHSEATPDRTETIFSANSTLRSKLTRTDYLVRAGDPVRQTTGEEYLDDF